MKNFTFTLRDIFAIAEECLSRHRNVIRVYTETKAISLGEFVDVMQHHGNVSELQPVLKRTGALAKQLVVELINQAFHDRYLTLTDFNAEELRVKAAMLFLGDDIDEIMELMSAVMSPVTTAISKILDTSSENRYSLIKYTICNTRLCVCVGEDLRHVVFKEHFGNKRWSGKRYSVTGKPLNDVPSLSYEFASVLSDDDEEVSFLGQLSNIMPVYVNEVVLPDAINPLNLDSDDDAGVSIDVNGTDDHTGTVERVDVLGLRDPQPNAQ